MPRIWVWQIPLAERHKEDKSNYRNPRLMAHFARGRECLEDLAWIIRGQPVMGVTSMIQRQKPILPHLQRAGLLAGGSMGRCLGQVFAGLRSPPLRRIGRPSWDGLTGKPGADAEGDFLGGARSPRPGGKAGGGPRQVMIADELERGRCPKGRDISLGVMPTSRACGARPSGGLVIRAGMASQENQGPMRRAIFSEGRGLRARVARPEAGQGKS